MRRSHRRSSRCLLALVLSTAAVPVVLAAGAPATQARPTIDDTDPARIVRPATLKRVQDGYYFGAWGQDSRLVVTLVEGGLRFRDPRSARWEDLAGVCDALRVRRGVAAVCPVPPGVTTADPLTLFLELRLGDDYVDTTTLGAEFRAEVLADAGREEIHLGAGDDFVNGAFDRDRIWGGAGDDFIRTGEGSDLAFGEEGRDRIVGLEAADELHGGDGDDVVEGGPGDDTLYGDVGADQLKCGDGSDAAEIDPADTRVGCERTP
ncbi:calcium-binding protein [Nocardioides stalactiti]|uniref:calcium-binding protein n=1 Tax=Nocardioides stalactiti TaxID=2755356 RepID=UPI001600F63F|nr:calcium-binding protein [Nocardioides stalactiti]